jgi:hypothetical protein
MRFKTNIHDIWALVPGPRKLCDSIDSQNVREVVDYAAAEVEKHALRFEGLTVTHEANPNHEHWHARIRNDKGTILLSMKLHDENTFGGFGVFCDCDTQLLLEFWSHLQSRFPAIWLFAPDLCLYTPEAAIAGPIA